MKRPAPIINIIATTLVLLTVLSLSDADESSPNATTMPRPRGVEPRLSFSPSTIESCTTSVVTLECSTRRGRSLEDRIAASESDDDNDNKDGDEEDKDNMGDSDDNESIEIPSIKIFKKSSGDEWEVFAELGDSESPTGAAVDDPAVEVTGKVGGSADESYLRVIWDMAGEETFGVYRCDVVALQTGNESTQVKDTVSTEPVTLRDSKSNSEEGSEDEILSTLLDMRAERQTDLEWKEELSEGLEKLTNSIRLLEQFARGNAYKLNRIIKELTTIKSTTTTKATPTTTTASTQRTFAPPTELDYTKKFVFLGMSSGDPSASTAPDTGSSGGEDKSGGDGDATGRRQDKANRRRARKTRVGRDTGERA